jgi:predicted homoserine dehydrogenase-like protein
MALALLADENFHGGIMRGLARRSPTVDLVRVQDVGMGGADDEVVLAWAAQNGRVLLTHDVQTITAFAYGRVEAGLPVSGVIEVNANLALGQAIDEVLLVAEAMSEEEIVARIIVFIPL